MKETNISEKFDTNNYHFNPDSKFGIYLIHGFSSSTYEVKKLATHLSQKGYQVRADNLPGHGTTIEDCNSTKYYEWLNAVEKGVAEMKNGKKTRALKYFEEANKDRDWRKLAQRKIDEINNPTKYEK